MTSTSWVDVRGTDRGQDRVDRPPAIWWVNQGHTYEVERDGGYVWASTTESSSPRAADSRALLRLRPGDLVVHVSNEVRAIGRVNDQPREARRPAELRRHLMELTGIKAPVDYWELHDPIALSEMRDRFDGVELFEREVRADDRHLTQIESSVAADMFEAFRDRWPPDAFMACDPVLFIGAGSPPSGWMLQVDPASWPIDGWLASAAPGAVATWTTTEPPTGMAPGQPIVLWRGRPDDGIVAVCELDGVAASAGGERAGCTDWEVSFRLVERLRTPITSHEARRHPTLVDLEVLRQPGGTSHRLTDDELEAIVGRVSAQGRARLSRSFDDAELPPPSVEDLERELYMPAGYLRRLALLLEDKRQVVLYGPSGTGKSYAALRFASSFAGDRGLVGVAPLRRSTTHESFVNGPLAASVAAARADPEHRRVLVVDETDGADVDAILGPLAFALEYREDATVVPELPKGAEAIPANLFVVATMTTLGSSPARLDAGLRRRFHLLPFLPDRPPVLGLLQRWLIANAPELSWVANVVDEVNGRLGVGVAPIGPTPFMRSEGLTSEWAELIWRHTVVPYLEGVGHGESELLDLAVLRELVLGERPPLTA